jgi:tRNA nucleotidyltransferase (CCA-adding enzyme)
MELPESFRTFLSEIRPTKSQRDDCKTGHETLRDRLNSNEELKPLLVGDFLQGSYRRATAVRPKGDTRSDVDITAVRDLIFAGGITSPASLA